MSMPYGTTAANWYTDEYEFRQMCGDAQSQARSPSAQEFAAQMVIAAKQRGLSTRISVKQMAWLCQIADHDVPKFIPPVDQLKWPKDPTK